MATRVVSIISRMNVGGPAVLLANLVDNLDQLEFDHTLITGTCDAGELDYLNLHQISGKVIKIPQLGRSLSLKRDFQTYISLLRTLRQLQPDVIHTHTSKAGLLGRLAAKTVSRNTKLIHTFHGHILYGYFSKKKTKFLLLFEVVLGNLTDVLVAVSPIIKKDLILAGVGKRANWRVIRPGVTLQATYPQSPASNTLVRGELVIGWIGRFTDIKQPILALEILNSLEAHIRNRTKLIMAGDGELFEPAREFAKANGLRVDFIGWVDDVSQVLREIDLLLLTSNNEGMPVVIVEAATFSIPTLSTNVGGVGDFVTDNVNGFLIGTSNSVALFAEKIEYLFSNPSRVKELGAAARKTVERDFSFRSFVQQHVELYRNN